jgi:hypothetical protein
MAPFLLLPWWRLPPTSKRLAERCISSVYVEIGGIFLTFLSACLSFSVKTDFLLSEDCARDGDSFAAELLVSS